MPRFMEYKESTYRLLTLVVWALGLILLASIVYVFTLFQANVVATGGWEMVGLGLQGLAFTAIGVVYLFFLYWKLKVGAVRSAVKGLHSACEAVLDDDGMGMLPRRSIIGEDGLRYDVVHNHDVTYKNGRIDEVFSIHRYLNGTIDHVWTVYPYKIIDRGRDLLPIALMSGFNGLAFAMRGWVRLNKTRHFGVTSDHPRLSTDVDNGEKILPVSV